jgi:hypothetical protein
MMLYPFYPKVHLKKIQGEITTVFDVESLHDLESVTQVVGKFLFSYNASSFESRVPYELKG